MDCWIREGRKGIVAAVAAAGIVVAFVGFVGQGGELFSSDESGIGVAIVVEASLEVDFCAIRPPPPLSRVMLCLNCCRM